MPKILKTFRLSEDAIKILLSMAKKQDRSEGYIIEQLILNASKKPKQS